MLVEFRDAGPAFCSLKELKYAEVRVYDAKEFDDLREYYPLLSKEEQERAGKFVRPQDAKVYTLSHAYLRLRLAKAIGTNPNSIVFQRNQYGKPYLSGYKLSFNLSHTRNFFSLIIGHQESIQVGVDVEEFRPTSQLDGVIKSYMHPAEIKEIKNDERTFFKFWTRKEALLKILGCGLVSNLHQINTTNGTRHIELKEFEALSFEYKTLIETICSNNLALSYAINTATNEL